MPTEQKKPNVVIPLSEYNRLKNDSNFLESLIMVGVDSWEGYSHAFEVYDEEFGGDL